MNTKMNIAAAVVLLMGLSGAAFAGMGGMKCGAGMAGMKGDFASQKAMMLKHLDEMEKCVENAKNQADLKTCRMQMMNRRKAMMSTATPTGATAKKMQCGAGKCGKGK